MSPRLLFLWGIFLIALLAPALGAEAQRRPRQRPAARSLEGLLMVAGEPSGAEVYIDGQLVGVLPLEAPISLPAGSHTVRVASPGFTEFNQVVQLRPGAREAVAVDLIAVSTSLLIASEPTGAHVFVDGNFAGDTPVTVELLEGTHAVRVSRFGFIDQLFEVAALAGSADTREVVLVAMPEEELERLQDAHSEWYEEPLPWALIGGGVAVVAIGVVAVVAATSETSSQSDAFCAGGTHSCAIFAF